MCNHLQCFDRCTPIYKPNLAKYCKILQIPQNLLQSIAVAKVYCSRKIALALALAKYGLGIGKIGQLAMIGHDWSILTDHWPIGHDWL